MHARLWRLKSFVEMRIKVKECFDRKECGNVYGL
jgi:hypothetical protein